MNGIYRFHRYLNHGNRVIAVFFGSLIFCAWALPLFVRFTQTEMIPPPVRLSLYLTITLLLGAYFCYRIVHEAHATTISLTGSYIEVRTPLSRKLINFATMTALRHVRLPLVRGYIRLTSPSGSIRLPFIVENLPALLREMQAGLERHGRQEVARQAKFDRILCEALVSEADTERILGGVKPLIRFSAIAFWGGYLVARLLWQMVWPWALSWVIISLLFPLVGFIAAEILLSRRGRKAVCAGKDPCAVDAVVIYVRVGIAAIACYLAAGIAFSAT